MSQTSQAAVSPGAPAVLPDQTPQAMVTVMCPLDRTNLARAEAAIDALGNPAGAELARALGALDPDGAGGTHFASLHAFASRDGARRHILLEINGDGDEEAALERFVSAIGDRLRPVFALASDWKDGDLRAYLREHRVAVGAGWFDHPGLCFAGTPGLAVGRIAFEQRLAQRVADLLAGQTGDLAALARVAAVRLALRGDPAFEAALTPADSPLRGGGASRLALAFALLTSGVRAFLWPVMALVVAWALVAAFRAAPHAGFWGAVGAGVAGLLMATVVALGILAVLAAVGYLVFRRAEVRDPVEDRMPDTRTNAEMYARENHFAQNHMISITERKPGLVRQFTSRLIFWAIGVFAGRLYPAGFLGQIGSIHFARWVTAPGTPDLVFLSNYDGGWEGYLEDFITKANQGLTGVWSNTVGFPRSENLINKGATDGERFKRYARRSMVPTRFWFSAYPTLTTRVIRTNAEIRRGLSGVMTEDEARRWLALFGSAARPASKLVSGGIQSLVFGGLGFLPHGTALVFDLPEGAAARDWLADVLPFVAFNDGRRLRHPAVVTLALGARGLSRLGLPNSAVESFPFAFNMGMVDPARARMLGDTGENAAEHWRWGRTQPDVILLVYGTTPEDVAELAARMRDRASAAGVADIHAIPLDMVCPGKAEPFGFADGVSQPVIRGTYKGMRGGDPIHLVEPGEFVLGYPNNRGAIEPGPVLPALADPDNLLPLVGGCEDFDRTRVDADRDLGFNGSFLVVRELEQDVAAFDEYCREQAELLAEMRRFGEPYPLVVAGTDDEKALAAEFIGAKMVGRWKDGSSIVRYPYESRARQKAREAAARDPDCDPRAAGGDSLVVRSPAMTDGAAPAVRGPSSASVANARIGDNDFLLGTEDPEGLRCPFGAHIRRANPRDSFDPGSEKEIGIVNRHRIMRVGRPYAAPEGGKPGLLFMCLNGDIERQFEIVQQDWLRSPSFHGLANETDPLLDDGAARSGFTIPTRDGPAVLAPLPRFVTTRGGGYFFLPGKRLLEFLSR